MSQLLHFAIQQVDPTTIGVPRVALTNNTLADVVGAVFVIVGSLAVLFMLIGAVRYVTSNGEQARITQAKNTILYALVGVIVSSMGFTVVQFVAGRLTGTLQ